MPYGGKSDPVIVSFSLKTLVQVSVQVNRKKRTLETLERANKQASNFISNHTYLISELKDMNGESYRTFRYSNHGSTMISTFHQEEINLLKTWLELYIQVQHADKWFWETIPQYTIDVNRGHQEMIDGYKFIQKALNIDESINNK
jgi:hypothetical protein